MMGKDQLETTIFPKQKRRPPQGDQDQERPCQYCLPGEPRGLKPVEWWGEDSNLRRLSQQIYSLPRLTASVPHLRALP